MRDLIKKILLESKELPKGEGFYIVFEDETDDITYEEVFKILEDDGCTWYVDGDKPTGERMMIHKENLLSTTPRKRVNAPGYTSKLAYLLLVLPDGRMTVEINTLNDLVVTKRDLIQDKKMRYPHVKIYKGLDFIRKFGEDSFDSGDVFDIMGESIFDDDRKEVPIKKNYYISFDNLSKSNTPLATYEKVFNILEEAGYRWLSGSYPTELMEDYKDMLLRQGYTLHMKLLGYPTIVFDTPVSNLSEWDDVYEAEDFVKEFGDNDFRAEDVFDLLD